MSRVSKNILVEMCGRIILIILTIIILTITIIFTVRTTCEIPSIQFVRLNDQKKNVYSRPENMSLC